MIDFMWHMAGCLGCLILNLCLVLFLALISVGLIVYALVVGRKIYREVKSRGWKQAIDDFERKILE